MCVCVSVMLGSVALHLQLVSLKESLLEEVKSSQAVLEFDHLRVSGWGTGTGTPTWAPCTQLGKMTVQLNFAVQFALYKS